MATSGRAEGVVASFDDPRGYGVVRGADRAERFFHCTAIADGSRTIEEGRAVTYEVVAGRLGRWEAVDLRPT